MNDIKKLLARIGAARDAIISRKEEQTGLDFMIDGVLMNCAVMLKEQQEEIENLIQTAQSMMEGVCLLKEQEAVEPSFNERMNHFVCRNCSLVLYEGRDDYCPSCGKRIAWDEYYIHEDETKGR